MRERPDGVTIVAGAGSNDTRHAVHLTERASELGVDGVLSVTPYYNRPNRRGIIAHFSEVGRASAVPVILYNIPARTGTDMPNDLLAELAQIEHVEYVKQSNEANLAPVPGLRICGPTMWLATRMPPASPMSSVRAKRSSLPAYTRRPATGARFASLDCLT